MTHRVFVYGTLKRGHPNNPLLAGSEFLGEGVTLPTYKMVATSFPAIMPDPGGKPVAGEVYAVDDATLARLDQLEIEGRSYDRVMIDAPSCQLGRRFWLWGKHSSQRNIAGRHDA